ncbi:MAG: hypothetical protein LBJ14_03905, partial [Desulfarculales bacterium]|nr:hypothetical protein [Desulfarculales bacterium]
MKNNGTVKGVKRLTDANTLTNAVSFLVESMIRGTVNTAEVVTVMSVQAGGAGNPAGYVDVKPLVCQTDAYNNTLPPATLYHLPYSRVQGGKAALVIDPAPGDIGLAVFAKRDSSGVKQGSQEPVPPASFRVFDQADGFYLGGFLNQKPEVWLEMDSAGGKIDLSTKAGNVQICCRESGNIDISANSGNVSLNSGGCISIAAPLINLWGKVNVNGTLMSGGVNVNAHIHIGVEPGPGESGPPSGSGPESPQALFDRTKEDLQALGKLDDKDCLLLCIPDIALGMAEKEEDENERQGWLYLRGMMIKWLTGPVNRNANNDNDPFLIDWDWVMGL